MKHAIRAAGALFPLVGLATAQVPTTNATVPPENLGLAVTPQAQAAYRQGPRTYVAVPEFFQGADLNGDGDAVDAVLTVHDARTGTVTSLGWTVGVMGSGYAVSVDGPFVTFHVPEVSQGGLDLNGDGDALDDVLHVHDARTGSTVNLGATIEDVMDFDAAVTGDAERIVLMLTEVTAAPGAIGGFATPYVHAWDPVKGLRYLGLVGGAALCGDEVRVQAFELGVDLNGDGDGLDGVLHRIDLETGAIQNLGIAGYFAGCTDVLLVDEAAQGADLDGNGYIGGLVAHALDPTTGSVTNLGIHGATYDPGLPVWGLPEDLASVPPDWVPITSPEIASDFNGDGDLDDVVLHVWDGTAGVLHNLGVDVGPQPLAVYTDVGTGNHVLVTVVYEPVTGVDGNGDGDTADHLLSLYDEAQGVSTLIPIAISPYEPALLSGSLLTFSAAEYDQGDTDLNGDGDALDLALVSIDLASGKVARLGWTCWVGNVVVEGQRVYALVDEDGLDRNGDGDTSDLVLHVFDAATGCGVNMGLAGVPSTFSSKSLSLEGGVLVLPVSEADQGGVDLNGDGDATDYVLHRVGPEL